MFADSAEVAATRTRGPAGGALWGLGLLMGVAAMYLLDAEHGEDRRAGVARRVRQYRDEVERKLSCLRRQLANSGLQLTWCER